MLCCAVLGHDLDTITFYDSKGEFVGVRRAGSGKPINVRAHMIAVVLGHCLTSLQVTCAAFT